MKLLKNGKMAKIALFVFLIIQPILDCRFLYSEMIIKMFGFSPTTIIRILFVLLMSAWLFFSKTNKKNKKIILIYILLIFIYTILHVAGNYALKITGYDTFSFSLINEVLYIIRMLIPFGIVFLVYSLNFNKKDFEKIVYITLSIISIVIIVSNVLKISHPSYASGVIKGNIFDWFLNPGKYNAYDLASKGWFNSANQISGLLMILMLFASYFYFEEFSFKKLICLLCTMISMIILGTRVGTYGCIITIIFVMLIDIGFFAFFKKKLKYKSYLGILTLILFYAILYPKAPIVSSLYTDKYISQEQEVDKIVDDILSNPSNGSEDKTSITYLVTKLSINPYYYKVMYPVSEHEDFWNYFLFNVPASERYNQRNIQKLITIDIDNNYSNWYTPIIGYGYTRFTNVNLYIEHDFLVHYYTIGIIGICLLLMPYILISVIVLTKMILTKKYNYFNIVLCISLLEISALSVVTGHIMDELIVTIYVGMIMGMVFSRLKVKEIEQ